MRAIDADELKIRLRVPCQKCALNGSKICKACEVNEFIDYIDSTSTVEPERPQGEWEFDSEFKEVGNPYGTYKCSRCGGHSSDKYSYCFWCGAQMKGGAE